MAPHHTRIRRSLRAAILLGVMAAGTPVRAQSTLPNGGHVAAGAATIGAPAGNSLTINQSSSRAVINWNSFSVGQPNAVNFVQPGSSAAILNRVTGATPSTIAGQINANGHVYLVNPNGIAITASGSVQVGGGFIASTLGISNGDFMSGNLAFTGTGASAGVSNAGRISVGEGGYAALIGGTAANSGVISVPLGKVALGSGERATFDLNGDGFLQVAAPTGATTAKGQALVSNSGRIDAAGGSVQLKAATVASAIRNAVNMSGVIAANSVSGHDGAITLGGGPGGAVVVTGTLETAGSSASGGNGGAITVDGARVRVGRRAVLNASGAKGGTVLVGVSAPGGADEAAQTTIASGAQILARGDPTVAGSGGYIETSGGALKLGDATIDAGRGGTWLTDPGNLTIDAAAAATINNALAAGTSVIEQTTATGTSGPGVTSTGNGDIGITSALAWNTAATLTLSAFNNIVVSAPITVSGNGTLVLTYNNNQGGISSGGALSFTIEQGSAQFTGGSGAGAALFINNGTPGSGNGTQYTLIYNTGLGADGLQGLGSTSGSFALAAPLDASGLTGLTASLITGFSGTFNGLGNAISNLTIASAGDAGLFGTIPAGTTIASLGLIGGSISGGGGGKVGALVGFNLGVISNSYADVPVSGGGQVGDLVGRNQGTITGSRATGTVTGSSSDDAGGLVGVSTTGSTIAQSFATGEVGGTGSAISFFGGLIGLTAGNITDSYATGAVACSGCKYTGGFAGALGGGSIANAYATGAVSGGTTVNAGFVGIMSSGAIANGYWDTVTAPGAPGIGANFGGSGTPTGLTTAALTAALPTGFSSSIWDNVHNQTTPYLLNNPGPVYLGTDGSATPTAYTPITTITALQNIGTNTTTLAGNYVLANDIDATGVTGFVPIGTTNANPFNGTFDGLGNVVAHLAINANGANVGLFGVVTFGSVVENFGLVDGSVQVSGSTNVGALVGFSGGTLINVYAENVSITGSIGAGGSVGGLVGQLHSGSSLTDAYWTGSISVSGASAVGGLVGFNLGTITDAYATGSASNASVTRLGGLVGLNSGGSISNVYAAVHVGSTGFGLVYQNDAGTVTNGYSDSDRAGTSTVVSNINGGTSTNVAALSGTQPFTASSYTGFTFTSTPGASGNAWVLVDVDGTLNNAGGAAGGTMPMLAFEASSSINNAHQLQLVAMNVAGDYTLARNIDATATGTSTGPTTGKDVWGCGSAPCVGTFVPLGGGGGADYSGTFDGAGHMISSLTINVAGSNPVGLFGLANGTIENVKLVNAAVTGNNVVGALVGELDSPGSVTGSASSGTVSGQFQIGGLIGETNGGSVANSSSSATVTATNDDIGGLIGQGFGDVTGSFATGSVSGNNGVGGLIGTAFGGTISQSFATGTATGFEGVGGLVGTAGGAITLNQDYATGATSASFAAGGLVGEARADLAITQSFASGAATSSISDSGGLVGAVAGGTTTITQSYAIGPATSAAIAGGLVGTVYDGNTLVIDEGYATGAVSGPSTGGLVGKKAPSGSVSITAGYYDAGTTGQPLGLQSDGSVGLATAALQTDLASLNFTSGVWGIVPGKSYPYLCWQLSACGGTPQVVSGTVYKDAGTTNAGAGLTVTGLADGTVFNSMLTGGTVTTGANGFYYYLLAPGAIATNGNVLTYAQNIPLVGGGTAGGAALADQVAAPGNVTGLTIFANTLHENTAQTTTAAVAADLSIAKGVNATANSVVALPINLQVDASGAFTIGNAITYAVGTVTVNAGGAIIEGAGGSITATNLIATTERDAGGAISLNQAGANTVTGNVTLTALNTAGAALAGGTIDYTDSTGFTIASLGGLRTGVGTTGAATLLAGGNVTIAAGATMAGNGVVLSTTGNFINNQGAGAVTATGGGRWLIYSAAPGGDNFGSLNSGNTAIWGASFATLPPASVTAGGNRYLFAQTQTLTVTTSDTSKSYGQDATAAIAAAFTETGFAPGVANAFLGDSAANVVTGAPSVTSAGSAATATVAGGPYAITAAAGSLTVASGYSIAFANTGVLGVTSAALTVTGSNQSKIYGQTLSLGTTAFTTSGLVNSDSINAVSLSSPGAAATATVAGSPYAITASNAVGSGLANYTISYTDGALSVTPAALTVTASNQSKVYGQTLSLETTAFTTSGLVNSDSVSAVSLSSAGAAATATVTSSPYAITASNAVGSGLANYTIGYTGGALSVTPRPITVSADDLSRPSGIANPSLTYTVTAGNLVNGDTLSGALATLASGASSPGRYPIVEGTLAATANYTLSFADGTLNVTSLADFGASPAKFVTPVLDSAPPPPSLTQCPPGAIAAALKDNGSVVLAGSGACGSS